MGYEYYIYPENKMDAECRKNLILTLKKHTLFFRERIVYGKTHYEFYETNQDAKPMPEFFIIFDDDNRIYLCDNGHASKKLWKILEDYLAANGGYKIDDDL